MHIYINHAYRNFYTTWGSQGAFFISLGSRQGAVKRCFQAPQNCQLRWFQCAQLQLKFSFPSKVARPSQCQTGPSWLRVMLSAAECRIFEKNPQIFWKCKTEVLLKGIKKSKEEGTAQVCSDAVPHPSLQKSGGKLLHFCCWGTNLWL